MAALFVNVLEKLKKFTRGNQAPFIAKIHKDGRVELWRNRTQLLKLLKGDNLSMDESTLAQKEVDEARAKGVLKDEGK